jgi:hypothetical protein
MAYTSREQARDYAKQYYQEHRKEIFAKNKVRTKKEV